MSVWIFPLLASGMKMREEEAAGEKKKFLSSLTDED